MAPRNSNNAQSNKTLRTACSACGADISSDVGNDPKNRTTWPLVGVEKGARRVFPTCTSCYKEGWRPPGFEAA
jgi:uncharacterized protein with PIN domain